MKAEHIPVLAREVIDGLQLKPGMTVLDGTLGLGGHAGLILDQIGDEGTLIGVDRDDRNLALAKDQLQEKPGTKQYIRDSYANIGEHNVEHIDAALYDLGFSSMHVDDASRGFSFQKEGPLDMRYDQSQSETAESIVNSWPREELAKMFRMYGEEPRSQEIAKAIFDARRKQRITRTTELADIIASVKRARSRQHPATQVFQALRIAVNDELGEMERGLVAGVHALKAGGRIAVITFHSLEDRFVKNFFKDNAELEVVTKKPLRPTFEEKKYNPRARSAKLRIAQKTEV